MIKERPILFSGDNVNAILAGRKTQTRRIVKPQPDEDGLAFGLRLKKWVDTSEKYFKCPYGVSGDRLWVRETHKIEQIKKGWRVIYKADNSFIDYMFDYVEWHEIGEKLRNYKGGWRPSIFMPRWASRINLEITDLRVERLQDISEEDARAEGVIPLRMDVINNRHTYMPRMEGLWDRLNAAPKPCYVTVDGKQIIDQYVSCPWENIQEDTTYRGKPYYIRGNPWVWVIGFKRGIEECTG